MTFPPELYAASLSHALRSLMFDIRPLGVCRSTILSSSAWLPLLYDSGVLILTLIQTVPRRDGSTIMQWLFQDGLIYYCAGSAISAVNTISMITILSAWQGLKNMVPEIKVAIMSRITLNLKRLGSKKKLMGTSMADSGRSIAFRPGGRQIEMMTSWVRVWRIRAARLRSGRAGGGWG
ncbi:hypothetical protein DFH08DRAFT_799408 [Mycena albidolilacea]|uniref:Uncharacterized protein n=1 Tax=Mycena albidolilacea TaxID=1033008 RepID=A0AAD7F0C2_9AGAR|nr:hypothetical protein DFH08DRAFT_799408 [Mycena albidolilacea]